MGVCCHVQTSSSHSRRRGGGGGGASSTVTCIASHSGLLPSRGPSSPSPSPIRSRAQKETDRYMPDGATASCCSWGPVSLSLCSSSPSPLRLFQPPPLSALLGLWMQRQAVQFQDLESHQQCEAARTCVYFLLHHPQHPSACLQASFTPLATSVCTR